MNFFETCVRMCYGVVCLFVFIPVAVLAVAPYQQRAAPSNGTTTVAMTKVTKYGVNAWFFNVSNARAFHVYASCDQKVGTQVLAQRYGCTLAMNAAPFLFPKVFPSYCIGRVVSDGRVILNNASSDDDFGLTSDGYWAFGSHSMGKLGDFTQLLTGFSMLVIRGKPVVAPLHSDVAPRTIIGTDSLGHLLMFQVDGVEKDKLGVTLAQAASWFASLGAYNAVNFDGGGSSTTYYEGHIVNCPTCLDRHFCCIRSVPTIFCVK